MSPPDSFRDDDRDLPADPAHLQQARAVWQAAIRRDEAVGRAASEERLLRTVESWTPPRRQPSALLLAAAFGACVAVALFARRSPSQGAVTEIHAERQPRPVLPEPTPARGELNDVASSPTLGATASARAPDPPAPAMSRPHRVDPALVSTPPAVLPPLPPPPPEAPLRAVRTRTKPSSVDRNELRLAAREMARGEVANARQRLRALGRNPDPSLAFEATVVLAQSYVEPREQLSIWDDAASTLDAGRYHALVERERTRIRVRMAARSDGGGAHLD